MASQPEAPASSPSKCPVYFCGNPKASGGFDTFFSNVEKISTVSAQRLTVLSEVTAKTGEMAFGIVIFLLSNKSDLVTLLNTLAAFKKKLAGGTVRLLAYNLLDNEKIASVIKAKGGAETFTEGLTQKALVHKLQKHVQIVSIKHKNRRQDNPADTASGKPGAAKPGATDRAKLDHSKLKFIAALQEPNDCWLVKNKRDFKYIRGNWIGELIGPGPSVGSWVEAGGTPTQPVFRWSPRKKDGVDPFVPGPGSWFFSGRKPEFDWKSNRWRFVGEVPSLFYRASDAAEGAAASFRFRSKSAAALEVALNSVAAKGKLKAIIETFNDEKVIKEDKKKPKDSKEVTLEKEKKKARGKDYDGDISPNEEAKEWGALQEGEEEQKEWGELKESDEEEEREWGDKSDEGEDEEKQDWSGLDVGKGNKFSSGRGVGQGDGQGDKGYKYDEEDGFKDRTGEGEEEDEHDWTGLDVGRGNKFESGRGLGQGTGEKGYKYDKDKKGARKKSGDDEDEDLLADGDELDEDEDFEDLSDDDDGDLAMDGELDELLGEPAEDKEWEIGASAFEKITLEITVSRIDAPNSPTLGDVSLLERQGADLLLDAPASSFTLGERVSFAVVLGNAGEKKKLQLTGSLKKMDPSGDNREIILVNVTEVSRPHLKEIETVFEQRQEQLLKFLREAKG
jgi:hypothetical protein